ncbi:MAG: VanZ family protein [Calditrichia bacterium]
MRYQLPAILTAVAIYMLSDMPDIQGPDFGIRFSDKYSHLIAYAVFGWLIARAFYFQDRYPVLREKWGRFTFITGSLYGISDEVHQYFVPGRFADPLDALADAAGVAIAVWIFSRFYFLRK